MMRKREVVPRYMYTYASQRINISMLCTSEHEKIKNKK